MRGKGKTAGQVPGQYTTEISSAIVEKNGAQ